MRVPLRRNSRGSSAHGLVWEFAQHGLPLEAVGAAVEALEQAILSCTNAKAMKSAAIEKWAAALDNMLLRCRSYGSSQGYTQARG